MNGCLPGRDALKLKVVRTDNGGADFGLAGDSITSVLGDRLNAGGTTTAFPKLSDLDTPEDVPGGFDFEDFRLALVV